MWPAGGAAPDKRKGEIVKKQKLLTKAILKALPRLGSLEDVGLDAVAQVKLFNPCGIGTWYLSEYDPETRIAFGLFVLHEAELGYVNLNELEALRCPPFGLPVERDIYWSKRPLRECVKGGAI